jgi:NAD(P)-dependent dehydrogenase (short-subunit alcohol dehydrogenase family)
MMARELALVVGGGGAIGSAIVGRLLDSGLEVVAIGRSADALARLAVRFPKVRSCVADMGDDAAIDAVQAAADGPVRMVVHSPGLDVAGGIDRASTAAVVQAVNIKVGGMLRLVRGVEERLSRGSRLVAIGGHYGFEPTAYAATAGVANAALVNLMRQLSWHHGPRGITAHVVAPGPADTDRLRRVAGDRARQRGTDVEAVLDEMRRESAILAFTTPQQVAWAVNLLLAPEADAFAGSTLMMDAGRRRGLP